MTTKILPILLAALIGLACWPAGIRAQDAAPQAAAETDEDPAEAESDDGGEDDAGDDDDKSYAEHLEESDTLTGLFELHQNRETGAVLMAIREDQLDREYIHFSHTADGVPTVGHFRGRFGDSKIVTFRRHFDRIEIVTENTAFYFDPDNALSKSADANISPAVLASAEITASSEDGTVHLIDADEVFLAEWFEQIKPSEDPDDDDADEDFQLGDLSEDRTRFTGLKNYPENTVLRVQYVFENLHPTADPEVADVTDPRFVSVKVQHTLIAAPDSGYQPRFDDPRVGYFTTQVTDLTSSRAAPYRDLVHRWKLEKKQPDAELSEPVEPIVWWIENTTPLELRDTVREAALRWNEAFEAAGFTNAVQVKQQPDDADWDADDIRYHVLRWTSSPDPPFGGYGPSFVDPRTGQILGADIMLEYVFVTNRVRMQRLLDLPGARSGPAMSPRERRLLELRACTLGADLQAGNILGTTALKATGAGDDEMKELLRQSLFYLVLHEIGHTIGLNHNFRASQLHAPDKLHDRDATEATGLVSSVMDYPATNLSLDRDKQGLYYTTRPGPYDHWAIQFAYSPATGAPDSAAELARLETILSRSTEPALAFANDADDMRRPGKAIDPRAMTGDLSGDALAWADERCDLVMNLLNGLETELPEDGESYHELRSAFSVLIGRYHNAMAAVSRYVGGVYVDRGVVGQPGAGQPLAPVDAADQRRAMDILQRRLFAADALQLAPELIAHLQYQRRGFDFFDVSGEDPKIIDFLSGMQNNVLAHLLHDNTLRRIVDTELYGNGYPLADMMSDLDEAIMSRGEATAIPSLRQTLQLHYVRLLIGIAGIEGDSDYVEPARSMAVLLLQEHRNSLQVLPGRDDVGRMTFAHLSHLRVLIDNALTP